MSGKKTIILGLAVLVAAALVILNISGLLGEQTVGDSCGTVSPDGRDECCERQNKDTEVPICVGGSWKYLPRGQGCSYVCDMQEPLLGGDKDEHGCIGSAGYSWCAAKNKCLRVWEEKCGEETLNESDPSKDDAIVIVRDFIFGAPFYKEAGGKDLNVTGVEVLSCVGCFKVNTEYYATSEDGSSMRVSLSVGLSNWSVVSAISGRRNPTLITSSDCDGKGGEVVDSDSCIGEVTNEGEVIGFESKVCCVSGQSETLTFQQAFKIAEASDCVKHGKLLSSGFRNDVTKTWWIDLEAYLDGCMPACVVDEKTLTAEVNWRCMGAVI